MSASAAGGGGGRTEGGSSGSGSKRAKTVAEALSIPKVRHTPDILSADPEKRKMYGTLFAATPTTQPALTNYFNKEVKGVLIVDEVEPPKEPPKEIKLPRGVVFLPGFLTLEDQRELMRAADEMALKLPWAIPEVLTPFGGGKRGFGNLFGTQAGSKWIGTTKKYEPMEGSVIPPAILQLSQRAVEEALTKARTSSPPLDVPFKAHPQGLSPPEKFFTVLANLYPPGWGTIAGHSDTTEVDSKEGGAKHPVVSFSVGDSADFVLEPEGQDPITLTLRSGDAILFGGEARLIKHGIPKPPKAGPRPRGLGMVGGRLNITVRVL